MQFLLLDKMMMTQVTLVSPDLALRRNICDRGNTFPNQEKSKSDVGQWNIWSSILILLFQSCPSCHKTFGAFAEGIQKFQKKYMKYIKSMHWKKIQNTYMDPFLHYLWIILCNLKDVAYFFSSQSCFPSMLTLWPHQIICPFSAHFLENIFFENCTNINQVLLFFQ